jgi:hypothetical protein
VPHIVAGYERVDAAEPDRRVEAHPDLDSRACEFDAAHSTS